MIGQTISHYRVLEKLGEGGMGVVYRAEDTRLGRPVALKFLSEELSRDAEAIERLKSEACAASALNHPNICTIYDIDETDGRSFIVMEYLAGEALDQLLVRGNPELPDALQYAILTCEALVAAHRRGIVHGDIKPGNVFITKDERVKLLDFGLSRLMAPAISVDGSTEKVEFKSSISGTLRYMSPEQARARETDCRSDIFSFGVLCYEMLAGQRPFDGDTATEIIAAVITKEPVSLDLLRPEVPSDFRRVVHKCLRKKPELRYQHTDDVLVDLNLLKSTMESRETVARKRRKSVAVLPFLNLSKLPDDEYFCEGITEDISTDLSKIKGLTVASRWLAKSHQAEGLDVCGVGRKLGVDSILQGSVQRARNRLRITAQLINVADGFHLWADKFDREIEDIFAVQDEIAVAIASRRRPLTSGESMLASLCGQWRLIPWCKAEPRRVAKVHFSGSQHEWPPIERYASSSPHIIEWMQAFCLETSTSFEQWRQVPQTQKDATVCLGTK